MDSAGWIRIASYVGSVFIGLAAAATDILGGSKTSQTAVATIEVQDVAGYPVLKGFWKSFITLHMPSK